ncbi:MAG: hypothetical protein KBA79_03980 [Candidatus Cloacimonetes bacterium]|nr:hypothetical protein [Candidatus Cloacimonadota bacterium]HNZ06876.1 hypothetical protein [Candidatus Cloacimonadota bacterium]HOH78710.1 hypothetical protein [Candidatus Cloacimonadota bacterium]
MRKYQVAVLVMLILGLAVSVMAQNWNNQSSTYYTISIPSTWTVAMETDSLFVATMQGSALTPLTVIVGVDPISEEEKDMSLEELAAKSLEEGNAEFIAMGLEDAIDVVESGEVKFNSYTAYHHLVKIAVMGMNITTDSYIFTKDNQSIQLMIMGDDTDIQAQAPQIASIKKSFKLK